MQELWNATRRELRKKLGDQLFDQHFAGFAPIEYDGERITVATPDEMAAILVDKNYRDLLESCVRSATGRRVLVTVSPEPLTSV